MAQGISPLSIEHLQNYYADIMRDSMGIMDSGEAIFYAQAQVVFFLLCGVCAKRCSLTPPRSRQYDYADDFILGCEDFGP